MPKFKPLPAIERLQELFIIDPTSPSGLRWRVNRGARKAGDVAGSQSVHYWYVILSLEKNKRHGYPVHRIVYKLHHAVDPQDSLIDHRDRNGFNNGVKNLRAVDYPTNMRNSLPRKDNKLREKNVQATQNGRYVVRIVANKKAHNIGTYDTIALAVAARDAAFIRLGLQTDDNI